MNQIYNKMIQNILSLMCNIDMQKDRAKTVLQQLHHTRAAEAHVGNVAHTALKYEQPNHVYCLTAVDKPEFIPHFWSAWT